MNATGKRRLLKLADFLETVPRKRLDMSIFATGDLRECGTSGCALGWATQIPSFRRAGLYLDETSPRLRGRPRIVDPFQVAREFFDLSAYDAADLFTPNYDGSDTPKEVAKRFRKFVASKAA
jgi:hypothetical protein